jgi:hypothetical protein
MNGDNFRLVNGSEAAWALGVFYASHRQFPEIGLPRAKTDYVSTQGVFQRQPKKRDAAHVMTDELREKLSKAQTRRQASRLGIRLAEMGAYRYLRRIKRLTQAEAVKVIAQERKRAK